MRKFFLLIVCLLTLVATASAQRQAARNNLSGSSFGGSQSGSSGSGMKRDTTHVDEIPKGVKMWTIDKRFGDITAQPMDTVTHMFQNSVFTSGLRGEYNTTGNLGAPRINRIFINRSKEDGDFLFSNPYDFFTVRPERFLFTNTLSPYANLSYDNCGNRTNGEDHFRANFAVNVNKQLGFGFKINYLYGRGYYNYQSTSLFNINLYASYIADRYQAHLLVTNNDQKVTENGGLTDDMYITHPETFSDNYATNELPVMLSNTWNRNKATNIFLSHRFNIGFNRKVPMTEAEIEAKKFAMESKKEEEARQKKQVDGEEDSNKKGKRGKKDEQPAFKGRPKNAVIAGDDKAPTDSLALRDDIITEVASVDTIPAAKDLANEDTLWLKNEYVPVTSLIHTAQFDTNRRIYQAHTSPSQYYANDFFNSDVIGGDSIFDETKYSRLRNTFALSMLEGFNKWMVAGIKLFAASDLRNYSLPNENGILTTYTDHNLSIGGQLSRTQGKLFHYNVSAETWLLGDDQAQVKIDGTANLNFSLFGDTVTLAASGFFHNERPNYYLRHFHSRHLWWDDDLSMQTHTHLEGLFAYKKTRSTLRIGVDELTNYTYLAGTYDISTSTGRTNNNVYVRQSNEAITLLTASLSQDFTLGPLNWENVITYQKSTKQEALPVPSLNVYSNLYLKFKIARVLATELGADLRYFSEYEAPDYAPVIGQFVVQENETKTKIGNYPIINLYANFNLKGTRFFLMYTHMNNGSGNRQAFLTPHYPTNGSILRMGLSWNFFN